MANSRNPSILAAMAGVTNGDFAKQCLIEGGAGMVTIGGYPIGREMIIASSKIAQRGRKEFILHVGREADEILNETHKIPDLSRLITNLRINSAKEANHIACEFENQLSEKPIIEINAHCQQPEITQFGGGQGLLQRFDVLADIISTFQSRNFKISLKIRGNAINPDFFIPKVNQWQIDFLHIDSYKNKTIGTDLDLLEEYTMKTNIPIIGNNSVVDITSAQAILTTGALYFSVARAARRNPNIFKALVKHF
ncbi:MAG: tRNA-dihydrouridine synthase [Candidatus Thorarchaeota archaeon]